MRRYVLAIGIFFILFMGKLAFGASEYKIAFVDLQEALNLCKAGQDAKEDFAKKVGKAEEKLSSQQEELKRLKEILEKQSTMLSEEARKQKERDYQTRIRDFKRLYQDSQDELKAQDGEITKEILQELVTVVQKYGKEKGFTFILERSESALLYADESMNLTEQIIKIYDGQYLEKKKVPKK